MAERQTPREEFESEFGFIIDEQWQWLKEFIERNDTAARLSSVSGIRHLESGVISHPSEYEFIMREGEDVRTDPTRPKYPDDFDDQRDLGWARFLGGRRVQRTQTSGSTDE